jgi:hypothetical protein
MLSVCLGLTVKEAENVIQDMRICVRKWEEHYKMFAVSAGDIEAVRGCFALAMGIKAL